jgi:XapX domain-containing protein
MKVRMDGTIAVLALFTGVLAGALFALLQVPIPAPPELPGILGIVGIYLGYKAIEWLGVGFDLLNVLGLR